MSIRLYDSRAQAIVDFAPLVAGQASLYVCGPTVQSAPHIGHLRSALVYDLWRRWLTHRGLSVTFIRNVTDIDDKILDGATGQEHWYALAYRVELEFTAAYQALGILAPTYEPRATASIAHMHALIERLIAAGHAYAADDESGDVYFDVASWPRYGELTRQKPEDLTEADESPVRAKRDPRDFALWKGAKPQEPTSAHWDSPWGPGRPGWHIECSAMAARYLGATFDIHGGGLDLRFPHHENELAQSAAAGDDFAQHWVHNGLVTIAGQKMSKSLGNSVFAAELLAAARPAVVRYWLGSAHYRSTIDYHDGALAEAEAALDRIESFLARAERRVAGTRFVDAPHEVPVDFATSLDDDLAIPQALAVLHETVRAGNAALDDDDVAAVADALGAVRAMVGVLGLDAASSDVGTDSDAAQRALGILVDRLIVERRAARESRDWASADRIRDDLAAAGIVLEDSPTATDWSIDG